jgi:hypothetical protein
VPNFTLERTAGSHALAAAAQRGRYAYGARVADKLLVLAAEPVGRRMQQRQGGE